MTVTRAILHKPFHSATLLCLLISGVTLSAISPASADHVLDFDGNDDYVTTPKWISGMHDEWTLEAWFRFDGGSLSNTKTIVLHRAHNEDKGIHLVPDWRIQFHEHYAAGQATQIFTDPIQPGVWYHVAMVSTPTHVKAYVNGELYDSLPRVYGSSDWDQNYAGSFVGGNAHDPAWSGTVPGSIDEVRVWNVARTGNQIAAYRCIPLLGSEPGLVAYYDFNEGSGQVANDASGHGNAGQLGNTDAEDSSDPSWAVSDNLCFGNEPSVAICNETAHFAWVSFDGPERDPDIAYSRCAADGACSPTRRLVRAPTEEVTPAVACEGDTVLVMWVDYRNGNTDIAYRRSTDGGDSFADLRFLVKGPAEEIAPTLAISGNVAVVVWQDDRNGNIDLASRRSVDGGATWGPPTFLVRSPFDDTQPVVDLDGTSALLAWVDRRSGSMDIASRTGVDLGNELVGTWNPLRFVVKGPGAEQHPDAAIDCELVNVLWSDSRHGNQDIALRRSTDGGDSFGPMTFLVRAPTDDSQPVMTGRNLGPDQVHCSGDEDVLARNALLSWVDERSGNENLSFRHSADGGETWGSTSRLVAAPTDEFDPSCDLQDGQAACAWTDTRTGCPEPITRMSQDGGVSWTGLNWLEHDSCQTCLVSRQALLGVWHYCESCDKPPFLDPQSCLELNGDDTMAFTLPNEECCDCPGSSCVSNVSSGLWSFDPEACSVTMDIFNLQLADENACWAEEFTATGAVDAYDGDTLILDFGVATLWFERDVTELPCYCPSN